MKPFNAKRAGWKTHVDGTLTVGLTTLYGRHPLEATATAPDGISAIPSVGVVRVVVSDPQSGKAVLDHVFCSLAKATRYLHDMETDTLLALQVAIKLRAIRE